MINQVSDFKTKITINTEYSKTQNLWFINYFHWLLHDGCSKKGIFLVLSCFITITMDIIMMTNLYLSSRIIVKRTEGT